MRNTFHREEKMKWLIVLTWVILIVTTLPLYAQPREWLWAKSFGGESPDVGYSVTSDNLGNGYVTGTIGGQANFGNTTVTGAIFVAKYDANGNWVWVSVMLGGGTSRGIALDSQNNVFITGKIYGTCVFGNETVVANTYGDVFVAKLGSEGNWTWVRKSDYGQYEAMGYDVAVDSADNILITGRTTSGAYFGSYGVSGSNGNLFVAKIDNNGNWLWAIAPGPDSTYDDYAKSITTDSLNNAYITGMLPGQCFFNGMQYGGGSFIAKVSPNGGWGWIKVNQYTGTIFNSVCTDSNNNVYATGNFSGHVEIGGIPLDSAGSSDVFVVKLNISGNWLWAQRGGGAIGDFGYSIASDAQNRLYISGKNDGSASFGDYNLSAGNSNFIGILDQNGEWLAALEEGSYQGSFGSQISVDPHMGIHFIGNFSDPMEMVGESLVSNGSTDVAIAKYGYPGLDLLSPNGGELFAASATKTIYWKPNSTITPINILISFDYGNNWLYLNQTPISAALGCFPVLIPMVNSSQCLIRIEASDYPGIWQDVSDAAFSIVMSPVPMLAISSPDEQSLKIKTGTECPISWVSDQVAFIDIDVSYNAGVSWESISQNVAAEPGDFLWSVPDTLSIRCYFRISDAQNPYNYDWSDHPFIICKLDIDSPSETEVWVEGTVRNITWEHGNVDNVKLLYSANGGSTWQEIVSSTPAASGYYAWTVPKLLAHQCKLRIVDTIDSRIYDESDHLFTIRPQIMLISPNGGEYLLANSIHRILWDSTPEVSQVLLDYSINNGATWQPIQATPYNAGLGNYDWIVPNMPGGQALVRVKKSGNTAIFDVSESVFSIVIQIIPPTADFEADVVYGLDCLTVAFYDLSQPGTGLITSWEWDFGDGGTSGEQRPQHTYLLPGIYDVSLTVTNSFMATNTLVRSNYITVVQSVPELTLISDRTMSFGPVYVQESSAYLPLSIQNTGGAMMTATNIHFMGQNSHFEFLPPPGETSILPGESNTIMVRFCPQTVGAIQDTIYIENNSVNEPLLKVRLTGTGLYVLPEAPQQVSITMVGNSAQLNWEAVTQNLHGYPMTPDYYFVYISSNPMSGYVLSSVSTTNSAQHPFVAIGADKMFYRITAVKFYRDLPLGTAGGDLPCGIRIGMKQEEVEGILMKLDSYGSRE